MSAPTSEQLEMFFNFLEEHRELARGHLRSVEGRLQSQRLWDEICTTLNSMGGCTKTVQQWQRVWTDKKYLSKKNLAASRRSASATGGGPSTAPQPSRWDLRVLAIMGEGFGEPQTTARVPAFIEESLTQPQQPTPATASQIEPESQVIGEFYFMNEPTEPSGTGNQPVLPAPREQRANEPARRPSNTRRARRPRNIDDSVTRRFIALEERRLTLQEAWTSEFAAIKAAIQEGFSQIVEALRERQP